MVLGTALLTMTALAPPETRDVLIRLGDSRRNLYVPIISAAALRPLQEYLVSLGCSAYKSARVIRALRSTLEKSVVRADAHTSASYGSHPSDVADMLALVITKDVSLVVASPDEYDRVAIPVQRYSGAEFITPDGLMTTLFTTTRYDERVIEALEDSAAAHLDRDFGLNTLLTTLESEGCGNIVLLVRERYESKMARLEINVGRRRQEMSEQRDATKPR